MAGIGIVYTLGGGVLPQIEAFLEVARRQNLSRAAEALFVSQPTLTARLQALEANLGEQLFVRTRRGMRLTDAGETFLPYAEHVVRALGDGRERLDELRRGIVGRLILGAPPTVSTYVLPDALARFSAGHPSVRLTVKTGTSEEILEMVLPDQVQLADLAGEALILFGRSASFRDDTEAIFHQAGVVPGRIMELDNIEAAKKMVERGLGISLVPASVVAAELAAGALTELDLGDAAPARRETVAVRRRDAGPPSGAVAVFLTMLRELETAG